MDILMPGQGGLQTIDQLRRAAPAVKIVAGHATALGADHFLSKPFEAADLVTLVATLLGQPEGRA